MVNPRCPKSCATEFTIRLVDVPISVQTPVICDTYDKGISALEGAIPICRLALITMGMKTATTAVLFTNGAMIAKRMKSVSNKKKGERVRSNSALIPDKEPQTCQP